MVYNYDENKISGYNNSVHDLPLNFLLYKHLYKLIKGHVATDFIYGIYFQTKAYIWWLLILIYASRE